MESSFGHDFSRVRVHSGPAAATLATRLDAHAFSVGQDIVLGAGQDSANRVTARLRHELAHVVQHDVTGRSIVARDAKDDPAPRAPAATMYRFTAFGREHVVTKDELDRLMADTAMRLSRRAQIFADAADYIRREFHENARNEGVVMGLARWSSDLYAGQSVPSDLVWQVPLYGARRTIEQLSEGPLMPELVARSARGLEVVSRSVDNAYRTWSEYHRRTIAGAEQLANHAELVRDVSFGMAIGIGAVVAAPVVAAGLGTGALATGVIVTAGGGAVGGVLRGTTSAAGQALTGDRVSGREVLGEAGRGLVSGTVDAATGLIAPGVSRAVTGVGGRAAAGLLGQKTATATAASLGRTAVGRVALRAAVQVPTGAAVGAGAGAVSAAAHGDFASIPSAAGRGAIQGAALGAVGSAHGPRGTPPTPPKAPAVAAGWPRSAPVGGATAEGVGPSFRYRRHPAPRQPDVSHGRGSGMSQGERLATYAEANAQSARTHVETKGANPDLAEVVAPVNPKNPATAAAGPGPFLNENLYTGKTQTRATRRLTERKVIEPSTDGAAIRVTQPQQYLQWLERAYVQRAGVRMDPRMRSAIERYLAQGELPTRGHVGGASPSTSGAGNLPGTHAEILSVNQALASGGPVGVATVRAGAGRGHFAACLHCAGILRQLGPDVRISTGEAVTRSQASTP